MKIPNPHEESHEISWDLTRIFVRDRWSSMSRPWDCNALILIVAVQELRLHEVPLLIRAFVKMPSMRITVVKSPIRLVTATQCKRLGGWVVCVIGLMIMLSYLPCILFSLPWLLPRWWWAGLTDNFVPASAFLGNVAALIGISRQHGCACGNLSRFRPDLGRKNLLRRVWGDCSSAIPKTGSECLNWALAASAVACRQMGVLHALC